MALLRQLDAVRRHDRRVAALTDMTLAAVRRAWRRLDAVAADVEDQYATVVAPQLLAVLYAAQIAAARESDGYLAQALAELGGFERQPVGSLVPESLAGWAGDGRPVASMFASNIGGVRVRVASLERAQAAPDLDDPLVRAFGDNLLARALAEFEQEVEAQVATLVADATRAAEAVAMAAHPDVAYYVRMVEPGACSRCVVLAGRKYQLAEAFERHPRCRCSHLPLTVAAPNSYLASPDAYFESLTEAQQDEAFGVAGAQAIRDGADVGKVVNARRGMRSAQVLGRDVLVTTEGTVRRGRGNAVRLMPETILGLAGDDAAERVRLLRFHGYLT